MTTSKIAEAGRAILHQLEALLGIRAQAFREELVKLLQLDADRHNVDVPLLELLYSQPESRNWLTRWSESGEANRSQQGRRRSPHFGVTVGEQAEPVQFSAYFPSTVSLDAWTDLLAYIHLPDARTVVREDSQRQLRSQSFGETRTNATTSLERGTEIQVVPHIPHCQVNPPHASVLWLEDWHRLSFRIRLEERTPTQRLGESQSGSLSFHIGPLLLGEVPLITTLVEEQPADPPPLRETPPVSSYRKIFCSYSHKDAAIVERLEAAYLALGDDYWRDVRKLRSGQDWSAEILEKIEQGDIFQLYWSPRAKPSMEVEKEWRAAHRLARPHFIRPVYWHKRIPKPPPELNSLHFAKLDAAP